MAAAKTEGKDETVIGEDGKRRCLKCNTVVILRHVHCPKCSSPPNEHEVRDYDETWRDGNVYCNLCGAFVRFYDAG
jgi:hypothetical protein